MVKTGIDNIRSILPHLKGKRIGLLAHPASINGKLQHTLDILLGLKSVKVTHLFGPEHGLYGTAQDMEGVTTQTDARTGLSITSLYGSTLETLSPQPQDLADIDILICDLQDIGSRYYTFIYTVTLCMKACAQAEIPVLVLDRPNPLGGLQVEGKILKKGFESFVGLYAGLPIRHGMTMGELALYFNEQEKISCDLKVVKMRGWKRKMTFDHTGLPWVLPSPNMSTLDTALVYPGMCLIEATEISEGRGTTRPFELVGAPFIDPFRLAAALKASKLPGVIFRPVTFKPTFQKHMHTDCGGVQLHVTDRLKFKPAVTGIAVLKAIHDLYPNDFRWREKPYEFVRDIPAIDLLTGDEIFREGLEKGKSLKELTADWKDGFAVFNARRKKYLLY